MQRIGGRRRSERIGSCNGGLVIEFNTGSNRSVNKSTENSWFFFSPPRLVLAKGLMEPRVGNKYRLGRKIGSGSFGEIYLGECFSIDDVKNSVSFVFVRN